MVKVTPSFINDENGVRPWPSTCLLVITLQAHGDVSQASQGQDSLGGLTKECGPNNFSTVLSRLICDFPEGPSPSLPNTPILSLDPSGVFRLVKPMPSTVPELISPLQTPGNGP